MSLQMFYTAGDAEVWVYLRDDQLFSRLVEKYPQETDAVYGLDDPGPLGLNEPKAVISRKELLAAVEKLLVAFKHDPELTPLRYVFDFEIIPGVPVTGDDEVLGVKLPGKKGRYSLFGGIGQCILREVELTPGSLPVYKEQLDVRGQTVIETESNGPIRIRSTKKRSPIAGDLKQLSKFLKSQSGETVTKRLL